MPRIKTQFLGFNAALSSEKWHFFGLTFDAALKVKRFPILIFNAALKNAQT